jgi:rhomboid protease GluP
MSEFAPAPPPPDRRTQARRAPATRFLFFAILAGFAVQIVTGAWRDAGRLAILGAINPVLIFEHHQYWRLFTALFLHGNGTIVGNILHLGLNLLALAQLGWLFETMFSTRRLLIIYFVTGLAASLTSAMRLPDWGMSIGASGAIFGLIGALITSLRRSPRYRHEARTKHLIEQFVFVALANLAIGFQIPQIDNAAHIGGLVAGLILGALLPHDVPPPPPSATVIDVQPRV